jgi:hypothetical protein
MTSSIMKNRDLEYAECDDKVVLEWFTQGMLDTWGWAEIEKRGGLEQLFRNAYPDAARIVDELYERGYYRYVEPSILPGVRVVTLEGLAQDDSLVGYSHYEVAEFYDIDALYKHVPPDLRIYLTDAEELEETGASEFLDEMQRFFSMEGLTVRVEYDQKGNGEIIAETAHGECRRKDVTRCTLEPVFYAFIRVLNDFLEFAGSDVRAYGVDGGNSAKVIFLNDDLYQYICSLDLESFDMFSVD